MVCIGSRRLLPLVRSACPVPHCLGHGWRLRGEGNTPFPPSLAGTVNSQRLLSAPSGPPTARYPPEFASQPLFERPVTAFATALLPPPP